ncbi:hypothetical protein D9M68_159250 [compost metagenome]
MIEVRRLEAVDIPHLLGIVRAPDIAEIEEGCGQGLRQALEHGLQYSVEPLLILYGGLPLAAFGEVSHVPGVVGVPWLISTTHLERHPRPFLRACRPLLARMLERHPTLTNYVDARNLAAIRWLQWLGFRMDSPVPYGPHRLTFRQFHLTRDRHHV